MIKLVNQTNIGAMNGQEEKQEVDFGYIQGDKIYLKGHLEYADRQIGVVKDTPEATVAYFKRKFELVEAKVNELEEEVSTHENKGSYLMKLIHLREYLSKFDGLGDFVPLYEGLDKLEATIREIIEDNRVRNQQIKEALVNDAKALMDSTEWRETAEAMKTLKMGWVKTGSAHKDKEDALQEEFEKTVQHFFDRRQEHHDLRQVKDKEKTEKFKVIIRRAESIKKSMDIKWASGEFKKLMADWRALGRVPNLKSEDLWKQFQEIGDEFFKRAKQYEKTRPKSAQRFAPRPTDRPSGRVPRQDFRPAQPQGVGTPEEKMQRKAELADKAEALTGMEVQEALNKAKKLQEEWQLTGMVPRHLKRDIQDRFNKAISLVYLKHAIFRSAIRNTFNYIEKSPREKIKVHMSILREFIRRDEAELIVFEQNMAKVSTSNSGQPMDKLLQPKHNIQLRKIEHKKEYLIELMSELSENDED